MSSYSFCCDRFNWETWHSKANDFTMIKIMIGVGKPSFNHRFTPRGYKIRNMKIIDLLFIFREQGSFYKRHQTTLNKIAQTDEYYIFHSCKLWNALTKYCHCLKVTLSVWFAESKLSLTTVKISKKTLLLTKKFNPSVPNAPFLYPLTISDNLTIYCFS